MKTNLPYLDSARLNVIFERVYDIVGTPDAESGPFNDERLDDLLRTLQAMQSFNYRHRPDDTSKLFAPMSALFRFERNSDGTTLWLSLILAIKELFGFSHKKLVELMSQVEVRK